MIVHVFCLWRRFLNTACSRRIGRLCAIVRCVMLLLFLWACVSVAVEFDLSVVLRFADGRLSVNVCNRKLFGVGC